MILIKREKLKYIKGIVFMFFISILLVGCRSTKLRTFDVPKPTDTSSRPISYQEKKVYHPDEYVFADNKFLGARLNGFDKIEASTYKATILPENEPINQSPNYAFRIWSAQEKEITIVLNYPTSRHRYWPKLSVDGKNWKPIDSSRFELIDNGKNARLKVKVNLNKLWVSAQEIHSSEDTKAWSKSIANNVDVLYKVIGKSKLGKELIALDIFSGDPNRKEMIVILSRQHPPEVTGYLAMQSFVEELLNDERLSADFRKKYRILVIPMVNPDGVDLGHWRHNIGGVDLNRDWAYYRQSEIKTIVNYIVDTSNESKNKVILGLDFHSTQKDLYYSFTDDLHSVIYPFKDYWLVGIGDAFADYTPDDKPFGLEQAISKVWFYKQFNAESLTYEIGDETSRDFIDLKARVAAKEMMKLLILK